MSDNPKKARCRRIRICLRKNWRRRPFFTAFCLGGLALIGGIIILSGICRAVVWENSTGRIYEQAEQVPQTPVALLLGCSWKRRKSFLSCCVVPNEVFFNRIEAAVELFKKGRVKHIICSGSSRPEENYDELPMMRQELLKRGVPPEAISVDPYGWRTLDSIIRLKTIWGIKKVVAVSQKYHLERAIFQGDHHGVDVIGYAAKPGPFFPRLRGNYHRESLAVIKLMLDIYITDKGPIFPHGKVSAKELARVHKSISTAD